MPSDTRHAIITKVIGVVKAEMLYWETRAGAARDKNLIDASFIYSHTAETLSNLRRKIAAAFEEPGDD